MSRSKRLVMFVLAGAFPLLVIVMVAGVILRGFFGHQVGIVILDPRTEKSDFIPSGAFREIVADVDLQNASFRTLRREGQNLESRVVSFVGAPLSTQRFPLLFEGYADANGFGLNPDGSGMFYYRYRDRSLCMFDGTAETVLMPKAASSGFSICLIRWIADNELLLLLAADPEVGRLRDAIIRLNIETKEARTLYEPTYIDHRQHAISPSGQLLAFLDGRQRHDIYEDLKVIDLQTGKLVCQFENVMRQLIGHPSWSPDGTRIAFSLGREIVTMDLQAKRGPVLVRIPESRICYSLLWADPDTLIYEEGTPDTKTLNRLEIQSGKRIQLRDIRINGRMYHIDGGKVLCEVGY